MTHIIRQNKAIFALRERRNTRDRSSQFPKFLLREGASIVLLSVELRLRCVQIINFVNPPSTFQQAPVTKLARSEARNVVTSATSSGLP